MEEEMKKLIIVGLLLVAGVCFAEEDYEVRIPTGVVFSDYVEPQIYLTLIHESYDVHISTPYIAVNENTGLKVELPVGTTLYLKK
jgi:hypothetical protein